MNNQIAIGIDIGGSHITSGAVTLNGLRILPNTTFSNKIDNKGSKEDIFKAWCKAINQTISSASLSGKIKIGFAMPGPFHYKTGLAMFEGNDKYENLFNVSIPNELPKYISDIDSFDLRFLNDATSFGVGASAMGNARDHSKVIAITLGTGFGSSFIKDSIPQVNTAEVPEGGCLWNKPYKESIADDYFSTRWCLKRYHELSSKEVKEVKEIAQTDDTYSKVMFKEFGENMADFMIPFLKKYQPQIIVMGGNISKASAFFLPTLEKEIYKAGIKVSFEMSEITEDAAIIGSANLFEPKFWNLIKEDLPNL